MSTIHPDNVAPDQPMTREEALAMHGARAIDEIPRDTRPLDDGEHGAHRR
jgi:hypothetical protein